MAVNYNIRELRALSEHLTTVTGIPFDQMNQSFLKRRLNYFNDKKGFRKGEQLIEFIMKDEFKEEFIAYMTIPVSELFRDAGLWRNIRHYLTELAFVSEINVWIPQVSSGEELYTLLIIAKEEGIIDKLNVTVGYSSNYKIDCIQKGYLRAKRMDTNLYNYKRFEGKAALEDYFDTKEDGLYLKNNLMDGVKFKKGLVTAGQPDEKMDLVLFRNAMLYYKKDYQSIFKNAIDDCLKPGGLLCVGVKEILPSPFSDRFECIDQKEKIYKKFKALMD